MVIVHAHELDFLERSRIPSKAELMIVYGRRSIGKIMLLERVYDILVREGRKALYIDGYEILSPEALFVISERTPTVDARNSAISLRDA